jgi:transcription elongation factor GreA
MMEARIRHLQHLIKHAVVQETPMGADVAGPGLIVTIVEVGETEAEEYLLASTPEERVPGVRTITPSSPLGSALVGRRVGDTAEVTAPGGKFSIELKGLRPR